METQTHEQNGKITGPTTDLKGKLLNSGANLQNLARNAGSRAGEMTATFADSAADYAKSSRDYVVKNPAKGVALAVAAGVVTGGFLTLIMKRRSS